MAKNRFHGKYYKFVSKDGFSFAFIKSHANEGDMLQVITPEGAYHLNDPYAIKVDGGHIIFDVHESNLNLAGDLSLGAFHPLKRKVMGPFTYLPMECSHDIYSMHHEVNGVLDINGNKISFDGGLGYIEGDKGTNFPSKYIWYNSLLPDATVTFAIASIPLFGFIHFTGLLCFIKYKDKEYRLCTYNGGKAITICEKHIVIRKGKLRLSIEVGDLSGHPLKAPVNGDMVRYIKENLRIPTKYRLTLGEETLLDNEDALSSLEYMW